MAGGVEKLIQQLKNDIESSIELATAENINTEELDILNDKITAKNKLLELHIKVNKNIQQIAGVPEGDEPKKSPRRATATGRNKK